jgi:hypothetical protein
VARLWRWHNADDGALGPGYHPRAFVTESRIPNAEVPLPEDHGLADPPAPAPERFLKTYQLAFPLAAGTLAVSCIPPLGVPFRTAEVLTWPVLCVWSLLIRRVGDSAMMHFAGLILWLGYLFVLWFGIVRGFRHASKDFTVALGLGRFEIPQRIAFTKGDRQEILQVRRVEFLTQPSTNWFWLAKQKYFDYTQESDQLWKTNLNEAGWSAERRP